MVPLTTTLEKLRYYAIHTQSKPIGLLWNGYVFCINTLFTYTFYTSKNTHTSNAAREFTSCSKWPPPCWQTCQSGPSSIPQSPNFNTNAFALPNERAIFPCIYTGELSWVCVCAEQKKRQSIAFCIACSAPHSHTNPPTRAQPQPQRVFTVGSWFVCFDFQRAALPRSKWNFYPENINSRFPEEANHRRNHQLGSASEAYHPQVHRIILCFVFIVCVCLCEISIVRFWLYMWLLLLDFYYCCLRLVKWSDLMQ